MTRPSRPAVLLHLLALLACLVAGTASANSTLPWTVVRELGRAGIAPDNVSAWVQPVDGGPPALAVNADRPMNPASAMKLVTAFAALERLGPAYSWKTRVMTRGPLIDGRLYGDLILIGGGDPLLSFERFWKLLRRTQASGVREITGDIVLDASALRLPPHDAASFDGRNLRPYNSGPSGLLLHFNTVHLHLQPGSSAGDPVRAVAMPPVSGVSYDNRLVTAGGKCGTWYRDLDAHLDASAPDTRLVLTGSLAADCGPRDWSASPLANGAYAEALTDGLWRDSGGSLAGRVRHGTAPQDATLLFEQESPSLAEAVREMNKWSSNVIAQQLLATLGLDAPPDTDMLTAGALSATEALSAAGIPTKSLVIDNGSGLSRNARVRAETLAALLVEAWKRPWMADFVASLSIAGIDGTARKRLDGHPAHGRARLKTGTLNGARAIAGYVLDRNGQRQVLVMLVNDPKAPQSEAAQDALIEWVWGGAGK